MNWLNSFKKIIYELSDKKEGEEIINHEPEKSSGKLGTTVTFNLLAIGLIIAFCYALKGILIPILFSIIFTSVLYPMCALLEKWRFSRFMASLTSVIIGVLIFAGLFYVLVSQTINIGQNATEIVDKIQVVLKDGERWLNETFHLSRSELISQGKEQLNKAAPGIGNYMTNFFGSLGSFLSLAVLVPLIIFFFLYYRDFFREFFVRAFYSAPRDKVEQTLSKIYESLKNYLGGMITVMTLIAVLNTVGLMVLGIEYAWFFGILAALLMNLPYIGIAIGSLVPALFALATKDSYWYAVGVIAWFQFIQFLEGNFITPNIVGGKISLNPLVSILSLFLFSMLFGFAGLILALPLTAVLKVIFDAVPELKPYGFLLSEPRKKYLRTDRQQRKRPLKAMKEDVEETIQRAKENS